MKKVREVLSQQLGREPTVRDIAQHLGLTPEQIVEAVHAGELHSPTSIDAPIHEAGDEGPALVDRVADTRREVAAVEDGVTLRQLGAVLDDRDREVVRLRTRRISSSVRSPSASVVRRRTSPASCGSR
jgi:RNA polymerase sigma-B factor